MGLSHSPRIVTDGLVLCLDAGNTKSYNTGISTTAWNDLSGLGNNGTLTNGPTFNSANGGSLSFDGTDDHVNCGNADSLNFGLGDFTVSVWFKRNTNPTVNLRILSKGGTNDTVSEAGFAFFGSDSGISFITNLTGTRQSIGDTPITVGQWTNLVGVLKRDDGQFLYKNGLLSVQLNYSSFTSTGSASGEKSLFIGKASGVNQLVWDGNISQVSIYNRALTAAEVQQNFNALRSRYGI